MVHFLDIPEEMIRYISGFLAIVDIVHLSGTCKLLSNMLPCYSIESKVIKINGPDINETGPSYPGHSWQPSFYFDTPPFTSHLFMATISANWKDQGWGNRKGSIYIQLMRPKRNSDDPTVVTQHFDLLGTAPHEMEKVVKVLSIEDPIIDMIEPGDYFRFMKNVGGGGGHRLIVKNFNVHTRGLRHRPKIDLPSNDSNISMHDDIEILRINEGSISDVVKRFKKQKELVRIPHDRTDSDWSDDDLSDTSLTVSDSNRMMIDYLSRLRRGPNWSSSSATSSESWS